MATIKILDESGGSDTSSIVEGISVWDVVVEHSGVCKVVYAILNIRKYINTSILQIFLASFLKKPGKNYFANGPRRGKNTMSYGEGLNRAILTWRLCWSKNGSGTTSLVILLIPS